MAGGVQPFAREPIAASIPLTLAIYIVVHFGSQKELQIALL